MDYVKDGTLIIQARTIKEVNSIDRVIVYADGCQREYLMHLPTVEERKEGEWIRTGRTNIYGGEELMCPFCGDRVMVQNIEYELYCRQCGALLGDRAEGE